MKADTCEIQDIAKEVREIKVETMQSKAVISELSIKIHGNGTRGIWQTLCNVEEKVEQLEKFMIARLAQEKILRWILGFVGSYTAYKAILDVIKIVK